MCNYIIGITGRSGSGKSTISKKFEKIGFKHIDIDTEIHKVIESNLTEIKERFGTSDKEELKSLAMENSINGQDYINFIMSKLYDTLKIEDNVVLDYAFLPITPYWEKCNLKVLCQEISPIRKIRIMERDDISFSQFDERELNSQRLVRYDITEMDIIIGNCG